MTTYARYIACAALLAATSCAPRAGAPPQARTITVAQSGTADVIGSDSNALRKAAAMLRPGDTLSIGEGTYEMDNSLVVGSGVTVKGVAGKTILRKRDGVESALAEDGDFGERMLAVAEPAKFHPGMGITVLDDAQASGWDISVSSVEAVDGKWLRISPQTERDYSLEQQHGRVRNTFPILCAMDAENVVFEDLTVDGNKERNAYIDGCRGGAIYCYRVRNVAIRNCTARNYNGDGISFQISDNVKVENCDSYGHTGYGVHPGTGSARPVVENCRLHDNGQIGLFLCWRVRHGRFAKNIIQNNGQYGISIGHKDTDNEFTGNTIARNGITGVYFRKETFLNSGHRNTFRENKVVDNGGPKGGYGFYVEPAAGDIVIENNEIAETRSQAGTQRYGVYRVSGAGTVQLKDNRMAGHSGGDYREASGRPQQGGM